MSIAKLSSFLFKELDDAKEKNLMVSLHLKATMMKVGF
jgi:monomeric isocitrate dehydrogenase